VSFFNAESSQGVEYIKIFSKKKV